MHNLLSSLRVDINSSLYLKDPESSSLGINIVKSSIDLIDLHGIEEFNFKKLAKAIGSTESSIYRYFENKHRLLLYISSLYWGIMEFQTVVQTNNMPDGMERLMKAVETLFSTPQTKCTSFEVEGQKLRHILNSEFVKAYHHKLVDEENEAGYFSIYKRLALRLSEMIAGVNANYRYNNSLASLIIEGSLNQYFLSEHFHNLTDCHSKDNLYEFYKDLLTKTLTS
ncbi:TetR/AcrR family transcriptional regulator [Psychroflexus sp. YR1-1]|uniref:TetR/AcrR family transcriptional regulator n=1 Tax=Psychroflexus aurantiacus TaxID=2709310 RepID=A0A6B3R1Y4_9FLAO|nr:TetR/AcrR family transcriptional regulator [Psychroflexus aurantiacus]NEV94593.1 TetR/AcrR family transcriptional regulator [Psychroflexus aurantiacus]